MQGLQELEGLVPGFSARMNVVKCRFAAISDCCCGLCCLCFSVWLLCAVRSSNIIVTGTCLYTDVTTGTLVAGDSSGSSLNHVVPGTEGPLGPTLLVHNFTLNRASSVTRGPSATATTKLYRITVCAARSVTVCECDILRALQYLMTSCHR